MNVWVVLAIALPIELVAIFIASWRFNAHYNGAPKWPWQAFRTETKGDS